MELISVSDQKFEFRFTPSDDGYCATILEGPLLY